MADPMTNFYQGASLGVMQKQDIGGVLRSSNYKVD